LTTGTDLKKIHISERILHYNDQGKGQPVIFVHGTLDDYRSWQFQIGPFSENYHVISYSRRFAYPNKKVGNVAAENTIEYNASDLAELIRKLDLAPVHLVGNSYGGFTALYCACRHPELVKTLVFGEPAIFPFLEKSPRKTDVELLQAFKIRAKGPSDDAFNRKDVEKAARVFLDGITGKQNIFDQYPEPVKKIIMDNAETLQGELESLMSTSFSVGDVKQISLPTLLVKAEHSPTFFHRIVEILSENIPNSEQITIPDVNHDDLGTASKPDLYNARVMEFLAKHNSL
jgi:non-heme chloroperoxidase